MSSYQVFSQPLAEYGTNAYLLVCGNQAIAIDAPPGAFSFFTHLISERNLQLDYLLLTHSHFDHISDAKKIQDLGIKVGIHNLDAGNCNHPGSDGLPLMMPVIPFKPDFTFTEGTCRLGGFEFQVIHTPGHTPGGCCFVFEEIMFSGDTLFKGSIGNLSFPTAEPYKMIESLEKLLLLPQQFTVYPGHGPKTSLLHEKQNINYFIKTIG